MSFQPAGRPSVTVGLARWAVDIQPTAEDLALADRALLDTVAVGLAARTEPILQIAAVLPEEAQWAVACHIIDFDDLHLPSTTHISTVCVPVSLSLGGGARSYLAGAGVMSRVGSALGWPHYAAGWHATTTAGAIGAAAGAAVALGLDADGVGRAMALAVPAAGGVQRSFGTDGKSLQVGFAAHAGMRAARLAAAGASADPYAVDDLIALLGGGVEKVDLSSPAIPDGLAIKLYPCCYALQRPIGAAAALRVGCVYSVAGVDVSSIRRIVVRTPQVTVKPLIHSRPRTGLEAKFSLEYAVLAALIDLAGEQLASALGQVDLDELDQRSDLRPAHLLVAEAVEADVLVDQRGHDGILQAELGLQTGARPGVDQGFDGDLWRAHHDPPDRRNVNACNAVNASDSKGSSRADGSLQCITTGVELDGQAVGDGRAGEVHLLDAPAQQRDQVVHGIRVRARAGGCQSRCPHARMRGEADLQRLAVGTEAALYPTGRWDRECHGAPDPVGIEPEGNGCPRRRTDRTGRCGRVPPGGVVRPAQCGTHPGHHTRAGEIAACPTAQRQRHRDTHRADVRRGWQVQVVEVDDVAGHRPLRLFGQDRGDLEDRLCAGGEPHGDGVQECAVSQCEVLGGGLYVDGPARKPDGDARPAGGLEAHESFPVLVRPSSARICSVCWPGAGIGPMTGSSPSSVAGGTSALIGPTGDSTSRQRFRAASCS